MGTLLPRAKAGLRGEPTGVGRGASDLSRARAAGVSLGTSCSERKARCFCISLKRLSRRSGMSISTGKVRSKPSTMRAGHSLSSITRGSSAGRMGGLMEAALTSRLGALGIEIGRMGCTSDLG